MKTVELVLDALLPGCTQRDVPLLKRERATPAQIRAIFAAAAARGLRDDVRALCGVSSMKELTRAAAQRVLDNWNSRSALRADGRVARPRGRRLAPGVVRPATRRQRRAIVHILRALGWRDPRHWLLENYGVRCVHCHALSTSVASRIITQLEAARSKGVARPPSAGSRGRRDRLDSGRREVRG